MAKKAAPAAPQPEVVTEPDDLSMLQGSDVMTDDAFGEMFTKMQEGTLPPESSEDPATAEPDATPEPEATTEPEPDTEEPASEETEPESEGAAIAENKRLRGLKRELSDEVQQLREELAKVNGRLDEAAKRQDAQADPVQAQLHAASEAELLDAKEKLDLAAFDANQDGDRDAYQRAVKGRQLVERELLARRSAPTPAADGSAETQFNTIKTTLLEKYPESLKPESPFGKAVQAFAKENTALMKRMGPLGEVLAVASVIGLHPELLTQKQAKQISQKIETGIAEVVNRSVKRGSSSHQPSTKPSVDVPNTIDGLNEMVEKMKRGEVALSQLG